MSFPLRTVLKRAFLVLFCLFGAVAAVNAFARIEFSGGGLTFAARLLLFAPGETRFSLPPLGFVTARTHRPPVRVELELRGLDPSFLRGLEEDPDVKRTVMTAVVRQARQAAYRAIFLALFLSGIGGLTAAFFARAGSPRVLAGAFWLGVVFCGGMLGLAWLDYDPEALSQPRYEGLLESAPWIMSILDDSLESLDRLGQGFAVMARNLPRLAQGGGLGAPMGEAEEDLRVLHVSDIHNNKAAYELIAALVKNFAVDLVIDTGDLTDYGTPLEGDLAAAISGLKVPYVFVPGNHDSPEVTARLRRLGNVVIPGGRVVRVKGLAILGLPDPAAAGNGTEVPSDSLLRRRGEELLAAWERAKEKPDVVAAHNFEVLRPLIGKARVLLHGHDHRASLKELRGTLIADAGTSGAAGYRGLASEEAVPYTVHLQYWRRKAGGGFSLVAVDEIGLDGLGGRLQVVRKVVGAESVQAGSR